MKVAIQPQGLITNLALKDFSKAVVPMIVDCFVRQKHIFMDTYCTSSKPNKAITVSGLSANFPLSVFKQGRRPEARVVVRYCNGECASVAQCIVFAPEAHLAHREVVKVTAEAQAADAFRQMPIYIEFGCVVWCLSTAPARGV